MRKDNAALCTDVSFEAPPQQQLQQKSPHQPRCRSRFRVRHGSSRDRDASVNVIAVDVDDVESSDCFIGVGATSDVDDADGTLAGDTSNQRLTCALQAGQWG